MICDAHVHFFSPAFFAGLGADQESLTRIGWDDPESTEALADRWVTELDRHGVAKSALLASLPGDADSVIKAVALHPTRFVGFFMLDPTRDDAIAYATRALDAGLRTICLFPAMHHYALHDERVRRVFELASAYGARSETPTSEAPVHRSLGEGGSRTRRETPSPTPAGLSTEALGAKAEVRRPVVFAHCGVLSVGVRKKLGLPSPFDIRFGNPLDLHGVASKFPTVPVVIPHFGAGMLREALMVASLCHNVMLDTSSSNSWVKQTPGLTLEQVFRSALDVAGPDRLLFGTDSSFFPRGWNQAVYAQQKSALDGLGVATSDQEKIFAGNFRRVFSDSALRAS